MSVFRAVVRRGHLVLDEPTDLPEGEVVELRYDGPDDGIESFDHLDEDARTKLEAALDRGWNEIDAGHGLSLKESLARLNTP